MRVVSSHPPRALRAKACRAACEEWPTETSASTSVSCHTGSPRGSTYSPRIVCGAGRRCLELLADRFEVRVAGPATHLAGDDLACPGRDDLDVVGLTER